MAKSKGNEAQSAAQTNGTFTVTMTQDKVTKNAVRFKEDHVSDTEADRIGQLYVQKASFPGGAPQQLRVTVESLGGAS